MKIIKISQSKLENSCIEILKSFNKQIQADIGRELISTYNLKVGDVLKPQPFHWCAKSIDQNFKITQINPDGTVNLFSMDTERPMLSSPLYAFKSSRDCCIGKNKILMGWIVNK